MSRPNCGVVLGGPAGELPVAGLPAEHLPPAGDQRGLIGQGGALPPGRRPPVLGLEPGHQRLQGGGDRGGALGEQPRRLDVHARGSPGPCRRGGSATTPRSAASSPPRRPAPRARAAASRHWVNRVKSSAAHRPVRAHRPCWRPGRARAAAGRGRASRAAGTAPRSGRARRPTARPRRRGAPRGRSRPSRPGSPAPPDARPSGSPPPPPARRRHSAAASWSPAAGASVAARSHATHSSVIDFGADSTTS